MRRLGIDLLVSLGTVVIALAIAELCARAFVSPDLVFLATLSKRHCWQRSALLGHENRPSCTCRDGQANVRINSSGLRGAELRQDGAVRILALGDSCTYGFEVNESASYPALLQRSLNDRGGSTRYEVVNAGVEGYTSLQGLLYFRERGLALRPAIVIFGFGFNDATPGGDIATLLRRQRPMFPFLQLSDWLRDRSTFWIWLTSGKSTDPTPQVSPDQYEANMREIGRLARQHEAKPLAISYSTTQYPPYDAALRKAADDGEFPVVEYRGAQLDAIHPSPMGNLGLAAALLTQLIEAGYVE